MKTLCLVRHAKSSWDEPDLTDIERPLNERGKKDIPRMGKKLKEKRVFPDIMLSSPARRAHETCRGIAKVLDFPPEKIILDKRLYHADKDQILKIIQEVKDLNDDEEVVMIFGHNPGLTDFANSLLGQAINNVPTCGVIRAAINVKSWKDVKYGSGEMKDFDFPKRKE
jgi:phosphohistidine phosphatase